MTLPEELTEVATPYWLPEMTLPAPAALPPTVVPGALPRITPYCWVPPPTVPVRSVPIQLPWMTVSKELPLAPTLMPAVLLAEMTLRVWEAVPPTCVRRPALMRMPMPLLRSDPSAPRPMTLP